MRTGIITLDQSSYISNMNNLLYLFQTELSIEGFLNFRDHKEQCNREGCGRVDKRS